MKLANSDWHAYTHFHGHGSRSYPKGWAAGSASRLKAHPGRRGQSISCSMQPLQPRLQQLQVPNNAKRRVPVLLVVNLTC